MRNALRLSIVGAVTAAAFALAAPALAAYDSPTLRIDNPSESVSGGGAVTMRITTAREDDPTARVVIYVPKGYTASLVPPVGTVIGPIQAQIAAGELVVPAEGQIRADAVANWAPQRAACLGPTGVADVVWVLSVTTATQTTLNIPMFVTTITGGPENEFAMAKLTVCLSPPALSPVPGAKLFTATLQLQNVFTNPAAAGSYRWRALFTPYASNTGPVNPAGTAEVQAVDTIPARLSLRAGKYNKRTKRLAVSGAVTEVRSGVAASVRILLNGRRVATVRSNARGQYRASIRIRRKGRYVLRATTVVAARTITGCSATPLFGGARCLRTVLDGFALTSATSRVRIR